jgi:hypothetical protein
MSLTKATNSMIKGAPVNVLDYGAVGDGVTDDTAAIQAALNSGAKKVKIPKGIYSVSGFTVPTHIVIEGDGLDTQFNLTGVGSYLFKSAAQDTMASADSVSYVTISDLSCFFSLGSQVGLSCVGMTYSTFKNLTFVMNSVGATGIECIPTVLAGSGGPSQWYNSFYDISNVGNSSALSAGAVGWDLGGSTATEEQCTTWNIFGGRTNFCDIGVWIKGATRLNFYGHTTESCNDNWVIGGGSTRSSKFITIAQCYIEGGIRGITLTAQSEDCTVDDIFITSITDTSQGGVYDSGARNTVIYPTAPRTWTPTLEGYSTAGIYALSVSNAWFEKTGSLVTVTARFTVTVTSPGTGVVKIGGLPHTTRSGQYLTGSVTTQNVTYPTSATYLAVASISTGATNDFSIIGIKDNAAYAYLPITNVVTGSEFILTFSYFI